MRDNNKILVFFIFIYLFVIILTNAYLFIKIREITSPREITTKAIGEVKLCWNHAPSMDYYGSCNYSVYQDELFECTINVTDEEDTSFSFQVFFPESSPVLFEISSEGNISFRPNASQIGNHTFDVMVMDSSPCANNYDYQEQYLYVINVNDPPVLTQPIPNQTWLQDSSISFDLDTYFYDIDGDVLLYTTLPDTLSNIIIEIENSNNIVRFTPISGWYGEETIVFYAWDPYYANASSNIVNLKVTQEEEESEETPSRGGGGGGGGGGAFLPSCLPNWYCRPFGKCEPDNLRRRECYDLNNCSTTFGMPNLTEPCQFISTCFDGFKGEEEEGIDCGGPCPPCGNCYDDLCNNEEDCTRGLTTTPDCGGLCKSCVYEKGGTCFDSICNNDEDCIRGLVDIPDCGGPCSPCSTIESPKPINLINWGLFSLLFVILLLSAYILKRIYPSLILIAKKKKKKYYEEKLLLETKISESIFESLLKLENMLDTEEIEKLILLFSAIVRRYFKSLLDMRYEFTYEELMNEIKTRNISSTFKTVLVNFFERSTEMEFSGKSVSKQEFMAMISEFKQILSFTSEQPLLEEEKQAAKTKKTGLNKLDNVFLKISEAEALLRKKDLNSAYLKYLNIVSDIKALSDKEKKRVEGFVSRVYDEINLAREEYLKDKDNKK